MTHPYSDYVKWWLYGIHLLHGNWRRLTGDIGLTYTTLNKLYRGKTKKPRETTIAKLQQFTDDNNIPYAPPLGYYIDQHTKHKKEEYIELIRKHVIAGPRVITYTMDDDVCWAVLTRPRYKAHTSVKLDDGRGNIKGIIKTDIFVVAVPNCTPVFEKGTLGYNLDTGKVAVKHIPDDIWCIFDNDDSLALLKSWMDISLLHLTGR